MYQCTSWKQMEPSGPNHDLHKESDSKGFCLKIYGSHNIESIPNWATDIDQMKHQKEIETIGQAHLRHDAQDILETLAPLEVHHPTTYQVCICEGGGQSCQTNCG